MRPEPHFDAALGAFRLPPDVPAPEPDNDEHDQEQAGSIARGVIGAGLLLVTVAAGIVVGCVLAFFAGRAA